MNRPLKLICSNFCVRLQKRNQQHHRIPYWTQETKNWRNKSRHLPQKWRHLPLVTRRSHPNNNVVQTPTTNIQATTKGETSTPTTSGLQGTNKTATMIINAKDHHTITGDHVSGRIIEGHPSIGEDHILEEGHRQGTTGDTLQINIQLHTTTDDNDHRQEATEADVPLIDTQGKTTGEDTLLKDNPTPETTEHTTLMIEQHQRVGVL